jgi:hypothetical protein
MQRTNSGGERFLRLRRLKGSGFIRFQRFRVERFKGSYVSDGSKVEEENNRRSRRNPERGTSKPADEQGPFAEPVGPERSAEPFCDRRLV